MCYTICKPVSEKELHLHGLHQPFMMLRAILEKKKKIRSNFNESYMLYKVVMLSKQGFLWWTKHPRDLVPMHCCNVIAY